ncbi:MAG: hypothetical protein ACREXX_13870 [Gammaproteobacteria bacterium]
MAKTENLVLEHLRLIRKELTELKEGRTGLQVEITTLGQQVAGLATAVYAGHDRFRAIEARIERLERRLDLTD